MTTRIFAAKTALILVLIFAGCKGDSEPIKNGNNSGGNGGGAGNKITHPTLFVVKGETEKLFTKIRSDAHLLEIHNNLIGACDLILTRPLHCTLV